MAPPAERPKLLIFVVAYYAEATILEVLRRIPDFPGFDTHVLLIDDGSEDGTFALSDRLRQSGEYKYPLTVLANPALKRTLAATSSPPSPRPNRRPPSWIPRRLPTSSPPTAGRPPSRDSPRESRSEETRLNFS